MILCNAPLCRLAAPDDNDRTLVTFRVWLYPSEDFIEIRPEFRRVDNYSMVLRFLCSSFGEIVRNSWFAAALQKEWSLVSNS
jgi:hypothetical protein